MRGVERSDSRNKEMRRLLQVCICALVIVSCAPKKAADPGRTDDYRKLNDQSASFNSAGLFDKALAAAERAIQANPAYSFAWNNKGIALLGLGRSDDALDAVNRSIELKPDNALAWSNKGVVLRIQGRLGEAIEATERALQLDPRNALVWYNKACYYALSEDRDAAFRSLATALELDPRLKVSAAREQELKSLWNDPAFKKLLE
jgi:tetratricopeptide (TPR) repeat protein